MLPYVILTEVTTHNYDIHKLLYPDLLHMLLVRDSEIYFQKFVPITMIVN